MTRGLRRAAIASLLLHALVAIPFVLRPEWLLGAPPPPPPVYAQVELVQQQTPTVGDGPAAPVLSNTAPADVPADPSPPPVQTPPPAQVSGDEPAPIDRAKPPAQPAQAPSASPPGPPPAIRLGDDTDQAGTGIVSGTQVIPASIDAKVLNKPPPYPPQAAARGEEGTVALIIHVDPQGRPESVDVAESSGSSALDRAALDAVRRWHFRAAQQDGVPIPSTLPLHIRFMLDDKSR